MKAALVLLLAGVCAGAQPQPAWDSSGNALLNGTYYFREVLWIADEQASTLLDEALSHYGTISFNGQGGYVIHGTEFSSVDQRARPYSISGQYAISAAGFGYLTRSRADGDEVHGLVANGVFIGSTTESGFTGLFIAARQPATPVTTASFQQSYTVAYAGLPGRNLAEIRDATFRLTPNGSGALGATPVSGYLGASFTPRSHTLAAPTYSFSGGVGTVHFGPRNPQELVSGSAQFYVAANGALIFGGAADGWDMWVGVRTPSGVTPSAYSGLYYQAGLDVDRSTLPGAAALGSYFGAFNVIADSQNIIGHQRLQVAPDNAYEFTYSDRYALAANGTLEDFLGFQHFLASDGAIRIGWGRRDFLGLNIALKAPVLAGAGIYLNPTGVVNAASYRPFTAGIAPGEVLSLFGTNLATETLADGTFPLSLGGVTVTINGRTAPLYVVSPTMISILVPFEIPPGVAEITVRRGAQTSNRVTVYVNRTSPGVFAVPPTGLGYAAATHADASLITPQNPARPGEVVAVYLTGLGPTQPRVATGAAAPAAEPLARTEQPITVRVANRNAEVLYSGLTPTTRGLYQINFRIPRDTPAGDHFLDIGAPDAFNSQILIPIGGARAAAANQTSEKTRRGFAGAGSGRPPSRSR
jgi:uncharacterized protein (TIGR03437 family)